MSQTISTALNHRANASPEAIAVSAPDRDPLRYDGLVRQVDFMSDRLKQLGLSPRDRVALVSPDGPESPAFNCPLAFRPAGLLEVGVLVQTLNEVRRHHQVLRRLLKNYCV